MPLDGSRAAITGHRRSDQLPPHRLARAWKLKVARVSLFRVIGCGTRAVRLRLAGSRPSRHAGRRLSDAAGTPVPARPSPPLSSRRGATRADRSTPSAARCPFAALKHCSAAAVSPTATGTVAAWRAPRRQGPPARRAVTERAADTSVPSIYVLWAVDQPRRFRPG